MASYILSMDTTVHADGSAAESAITSAGGSVSKTYSLPLTFKVDITAEQLATLSGVSHSELEGQSLTATHAGSLYNVQHLTYSSRNLQTGGNAPNWNPAHTGSGVTIYLLDTGLVTDHAEYTNATTSNLYNCAGATGFVDTDGHGTAIGSLIVGENIGTAPDATLKNVKLFDASNGTITVGEVVDALEEVLVDHNNNTPSKPKVVCMPWTATKNLLIDQKLSQLQDNNLLLVAAAGNDGVDVDNFSPGGLDSITTVGAFDATNFQTPSVTSFTNMPLINYVADETLVHTNNVNGAKVDIFAVGVDVCVSDFANASNYVEFTGTSPATGIVAGCYAHWIEKNPTADARTQRSILLTEGNQSAYGFANGNTTLSYNNIDANGDYAAGKIVDFANVSYSMAYVPHASDVVLASKSSGLVMTQQHNSTATVNIGLNADAANVEVLEFSPLSPFMSFDSSTGILTVDTSDASTAPESIAPGIYNFAIRGEINGGTYIEEYQVGIYKDEASELDGAEEYYYDTTEEDYDAVISYAVAPGNAQKP